MPASSSPVPTLRICIDPTGELNGVDTCSAMTGQASTVTPATNKAAILKKVLIEAPIWSIEVFNSFDRTDNIGQAYTELVVDDHNFAMRN